MTGRSWLIWNNDRGAWWRHRGGYTLDITDAERLHQLAAQVAADRGKLAGGVPCDVPVMAPTGRVVVPTGLDSPTLREVAAAIDRQIGAGPVVLDLLVVRAMLAQTVTGVPPAPKPTHGVIRDGEVPQ